ncbi:MAG: iron-containing alcohol dehydrogenase [Mycoplasmoidaceae bacterium]
MSNKFELRTKFYFGKESILNIRDEIIKGKFKNIMITYGGGSIKKNGIYSSLIEILKVCNVYFIEFGGIKPNPRDIDAFKASVMARSENIDLIIAVGGGSTIDASKVIATLATNPQYADAWSYVEDSSRAKNPPIPIISIITLAGTGSENNAGSVITSVSKRLKMPVFNELATPFVTIEDPEYTMSVDKWQTASGIFDCFSHLLEQYYGENTFGWTKEIIFANLRVLLKYGPKAVSDPTNYDSRANILWTTSMSLNGMTSFESDSDWSVHFMEHAISAKWDVSHGAGLALITPTYIKLRCNHQEWFKNKTLILAKEVFNINNIEEFITFLNNWIIKIALPIKWSDFKEIPSVSEHDYQEMVIHTIKGGGLLSRDFYMSVFKNIPK